MHLSNVATAVAGLALLASTTTAAKVTNPKRVPKNAVLLSKVSSLTLRAGASTASRRVSAVPQLACVGPKDVCKLYQVDMMRCTNEGADYDEANIQWSCKASLPEEFKLGSTDVICEGYESSEDPYVLKGSCGVEYRLLLTDKGEEKYRKPKPPMFQWNTQPREQRPVSSPKPSETSSTIAKTLFLIIFAGVFLTILVSMCWRASQNPPRRGGARTNGGGGGNNNDGDDPPPPYDGPPPYYDSPPRKPKPRTQRTAPRSAPSATTNSSRAVPQREQDQAWRPGFWTGTAAGTAAGAAAAYMASNRSGTQIERQPPAPPPPPRPETQQRPGGFFSSFLSPQPRPQSRPVPQEPSYSASSSSSPSYSSTRHESTGFGSTRRR